MVRMLATGKSIVHGFPKDTTSFAKLNKCRNIQTQQNDLWHSEFFKAQQPVEKQQMITHDCSKFP